MLSHLYVECVGKKKEQKQISDWWLPGVGVGV